MPEWVHDLSCWLFYQEHSADWWLVVLAALAGSAALWQVTESRASKEASLRPVMVVVSAWASTEGPGEITFRNVGPGPALRLRVRVFAAELRAVPKYDDPIEPHIVGTVEPIFHEFFAGVAPGETNGFELSFPPRFNLVPIVIVTQFEFADCFGRAYKGDEQRFYTVNGFGEGREHPGHPDYVANATESTPPPHDPASSN